MDRQFVKSSNIHSIGYDLESQTLEVKFKWGGLYHYFNVEEYEFVELMTASSVGKYFNKYISAKHEYKIM